MVIEPSSLFGDRQRFPTAAEPRQSAATVPTRASRQGARAPRSVSVELPNPQSRPDARANDAPFARLLCARTARSIATRRAMAADVVMHDDVRFEPARTIDAVMPEKRLLPAQRERLLAYAQQAPRAVISNATSHVFALFRPCAVGRQLSFGHRQVPRRAPGESQAAASRTRAATTRVRRTRFAPIEPCRMQSALRLRSYPCARPANARGSPR